MLLALICLIWQEYKVKELQSGGLIQVAGIIDSAEARMLIESGVNHLGFLLSVKLCFTQSRSFAGNCIPKQSLGTSQAQPSWLCYQLEIPEHIFRIPKHYALKENRTSKERMSGK